MPFYRATPWCLVLISGTYSRMPKEASVSLPVFTQSSSALIVRSPHAVSSPVRSRAPFTCATHQMR